MWISACVNSCSRMKAITAPVANPSLWVLQSGLFCLSVSKMSAAKPYWKVIVLFDGSQPLTEQERLELGVGVHARDLAGGAVGLHDVDRAPVGDVRDRKPRDLAQRALVVERRHKQPARLREEPQCALRVHHRAPQQGRGALLGVGVLLGQGDPRPVHLAPRPGTKPAKLPGGDRPLDREAAADKGLDAAAD